MEAGLFWRWMAKGRRHGFCLRRSRLAPVPMVLTTAANGFLRCAPPLFAGRVVPLSREPCACTPAFKCFDRNTPTPTPRHRYPMSPPRALLTRWLPVLIWATLIFIGSSDVLAARHTSRFIVPLLRWLLGANFTPERAEFYHHLIRKGGHLSEYAVLCVLLWRALGSLRFFREGDGKPRRFALYWSAVLGAACYAATDEFHQSFIPTRTASIYDVMIDGTGAIAGLAIYVALTQIGMRWHRVRTLKQPQGQS